MSPESLVVTERVAPSVMWEKGRRSPDRALTAEELEVVNDPQMNEIEAFLLSLPQTEYPLREIFIPRNGALDSGMYVREVVLPAEVFFTTEIHNTRHPFVLSQGHVKVWTRRDGWKELHAPYLGITEPPARRLITTFSETIWSTFHSINEVDPEKIKEALLIPHVVAAHHSREVAEKIRNIMLSAALK